MVQICVSCNQQNMHLAEGANPANPVSGDERMMQYSNSVVSSQQTQREQVPLHIPSSQMNTQPVSVHAALQGSTNQSGNPSSIGPVKSSIHEGALNVRYKVRICLNIDRID